MTRTELIVLVKRIQAIDGTESEIDRMLNLFLANTMDPDAVDYIFAKQYEELSAEQIVDKVLSYVPTELPPRFN